MRKIIYKGEFNNLCRQLEVSVEARKALLDIFDNTQYSAQEYFELKSEYYNYEKIKEKFLSIVGEITKETLLRNVFSIQSDLEWIPEDLLREIKLKKVAVFVGAGLSKLVSHKYPLWGELADQAINFLHEEGKINFYERERLKKDIPDPKQKLSIFEKYLENGKVKGKDSPEFYKFIKNKLDFEKETYSEKYSNPYQLLCSESFNFIKVTSNLDLEFAKTLKETIESENISLNPSGGEPQSSSIALKDAINYIGDTDIDSGFAKNKVYLIHGNVSEPGRVVLTTEDYINEYFNDQGKIRKFLSQLFEDYTVLFISYGLAEFPILERIFAPDKDFPREIKKTAKKHFILLPTYYTDISYFKVQKAYFDKLGIIAIPYYLDTDGYYRICRVLESWKKTIDREPIENIESIKLFLENEQGVDNVIKIINQDENSFNYLFLNLKSVKHWYDFKSEGFIKPDKFLTPKIGVKNADYFIYTPIVYLESISENIKNGTLDNASYSLEIVSLINEISSKAKKQRKELSLRTRLFFVDILSNIPNEYISIEFIENHIASWINSKEAINYLDYSIYARLLRNFFISNHGDNLEKAEKLFEILIHETLKFDRIEEHYLIAGFTDNDRTKSIYKIIGEKFSDQFIEFLIKEIEDFLVKKYIYTLSYKLDGQEKNIQLRYLGNKIFEEKLEDGSGLKFTFDPKGNGRDLAELVVKKLEKQNTTRITDLTENFGELGKEYFEFHPNERDYSIFDEQESYDNDIKSLINILKYALAERSIIKNSFVRPLMDSFINERHAFFIQLSLFIINYNWEFNDFIVPILEKRPNIVFEDQVIKNDLRKFLKENIHKLSKEQKKLLDKKIDNGPYKYKDSYEDISIKYWKIRWYNVLKEDILFKKRYDILSKDKQYSSDELDDSGQTRFYSTFSPIPVEKLNEKGNQEIIEFIQTFSPDSDEKWKRGSIKQLAVSIAQLQKLNPPKFYELIESDFVFPYVYADSIINAFEENWKNEKDRIFVDLSLVFKFIENYLEYVIIEKKDLIIQSETYIDFKKVAGSVAHFISCGNEAKENEFPKEYLDRCKKIILTLTANIKIYEHTRTTKILDTTNIQEYTLNHSLNSDQGKILYAHFYLSRKYASQKENKINRLRPEFKKSLASCIDLQVRDAFIIFGSFITSYAYWDEEFTFNLIDKFIELDDGNWKSFFGGWLFWDFRGYSPQLHKKLIPHYFRSLETGFDIKGISETSGVTRKIVIAYYWGYEEVSGSLINAFLKKSSIEKLGRLVNLLRYDYKELKKDNEMFKRVTPLWDKIIEELKLRKERERFKVIAETLSLSKYVNNFDEEFYNRALFVLNSECEHIFLKDFLKDLQKFLKKDKKLNTCKYICSLIEIIVNKYYPRPDDDLKNLMTDLFDTKLTDLHDQLKNICNRIIEVGEGYISWPSELVKKYLGK